MHLLIVKTSSLGDVIHTLPALTDALSHDPTLTCDWVVEEAFAEVPSWHPVVLRVLPVAMRRWRKHPLQMWKKGEWQAFKNALHATDYDRIIDAQGLIKSAFLSYQAPGERYGFDRDSAREGLASLAYQHKLRIAQDLHAVERTRRLFAAALGYPMPDSPPDYGITPHFRVFHTTTAPSVMLLHGTTWETKHYPGPYWAELIDYMVSAGYEVRIPWGNAVEKQRAEALAMRHPLQISVIPKGGLYNIALELLQTRAVVGVDTGLAHLAAALRVPSVTLYGSTNAYKTGTFGENQIHLQAVYPCSPCLKKSCKHYETLEVMPACYQSLSPDKVWQRLRVLLASLEDEKQHSSRF